MKVIDGESGEKLLEILKMIGVNPVVKRLETAEGEPTGRVYVDRFEFKFVHYKPKPPHK